MKKEIYSYNSESLTCNDRPILPIMGEFHFSRYPEGEWKTALKKMQQGGVDIVAAYVFWIHHEEAEGEWDFSGRRNLKAFLNCCQEAGMNICSKKNYFQNRKAFNSRKLPLFAILRRYLQKTYHVRNRSFFKRS